MKKIAILNFKGGTGKTGLDKDLCWLPRGKMLIETIWGTFLGEDDLYDLGKIKARLSKEFVIG